MRLQNLLRFLFLLLFVAKRVDCFTVQGQTTTMQLIQTIRGGETVLKALPLSGLLESGPFGIVALTSIAASVCVPATQIKNLYGISVGYGLAVAAISLYLSVVFGQYSSILLAGIFYGLRLALHLLVRDVTGMKSLSTDKDPSRLKRIPFAISLSLFYGFLCTPLLYGCRHPAENVAWKVRTAEMGTVLAWIGASLEAVADLHKFVSKIKNKDTSGFRGPVNGVYRITRHPNYTGEILFWLGVFVSGLPSFGRSVVGWLCSVLGFFGIYSIMTSATRKLEEKQSEAYGRQKLYEEWKKKSPFPVLPLVKGRALQK